MPPASSPASSWLWVSGGRDFAVSDALKPDDVQRLLPPGLRAESERRTKLCRVWLDTVDGRLAKRGFTLVHLSDGDKRQLVLDAEPRSLAVATGDELPRWAADLPPTMAARVSPLMGLRALIPMRTVEATAVVLRVLDAEEKTIGRVWLERPPRGGAQTVRVDHLRGYERQADRVAKALSRDPRLTTVFPPKAGTAPGPRRPTLTRDQAATHAVGLVLGHLFDVIEANIEGTSAAIDTEFLHDLRVAVRRTRSAMKLTSDVLPTRFVARFAGRARWLGDLTTPARDLDVMLLELPAMQATLPDGTGTDLEPLRDLLRERVVNEYAVLAKGLHSARIRQFGSSYRTELATIAASPARAPLAGDAADRWAAAALQRVLKRGARITPASPAESLHDLRKRCKELRYCLELFEPLWDARDLGQVIEELKSLQDNLGMFQDSEVQSEMLRHWAEELATTRNAPTGTAIAIGRLTVHLEASQHAARAEFAERFNRFGRPANRARFAALTGGVR
jgi:CHAD domain-containing protein